MSAKQKRLLLQLPLLAAILIWAVSCNPKSKDEETEIVVTSAIVAVRNFNLQKNDSVLNKLDSVFFSIDLKTGVIFNADSLPKGTNVSRLIPVITFANNMSKAELKFLKDDEETTVDYLKSPSDTVDFSYPVTLDVTALNGTSSFTYTIKVNVHKQDPDTLIWDKIASSPLPSRYTNPVEQKTVSRNDIVYSLIEEYNGSLTLATSSNLFEGSWQKEEINPGFTPEIKSFTAGTDNFYILDATGQLYVSSDAKSWQSTQDNWTSILGAYGDGVLGIKLDGSQYLFTQYNAFQSFEETEVNPGFPIYASSPLGVFESSWAKLPMAILACGVTAEGEYTSDVWAFDGKRWAVVNDNVLPAVENPMMTRYVVYRETPQLFKQREFDVWLLFGGLMEDGTVNRTLYISYDNGVNWKVAPEGMQLNEIVPSLSGSDLIVASTDLTTDLANAWTKTASTLKSRGSYTITGTDITWQCPYLYIFGGYDNNRLNTNIYRGVLERLKFTPQI